VRGRIDPNVLHDEQDAATTGTSLHFINKEK
jgi:hypothetical protein